MVGLEFSDLFKALEENYNISTEEIYKIADRYKDERINKELELKRNIENHYNSLVGKYFVINFNGSSKIFFQLTQKPNGTFCPMTYNVINNGSKWQLSEEPRTINKLWLPNPYQNIGDASNKTREISKEEFDNLYNEFIKAKNINNKLMEIL